MADEIGYKYIIATQGGFNNYISFHEDLLIKLVDFLHDEGFKIHQCAGWYWRQQMFSKGDDKDVLGHTFYLDETFEVENLSIKKF